MNLVIISGSSRKPSLTKRVADYLVSYFSKNTDHTIQFINLQETELPYVEMAWGSVDKAPEKYKPLAEIMFGADAFILVSPEYNGSYTAALKNLLDHFPKQHRKPFGIVTGSPGALAGIRAAHQLQLLVIGLFGIPSPYMLLVPMLDKKFDAEGNLTDPTFESSVHQFANEFLFIAERLTINELQPA